MSEDKPTYINGYEVRIIVEHYNGVGEFDRNVNRVMHRQFITDELITDIFPGVLPEIMRKLMDDVSSAMGWK